MTKAVQSPVPVPISLPGPVPNLNLLPSPQELSAWVTWHDATQQDESGREAGRPEQGQWILPGRIPEHFMEEVTWGQKKRPEFEAGGLSKAGWEKKCPREGQRDVYSGKERRQVVTRDSLERWARP